MCEEQQAWDAPWGQGIKELRVMWGYQGSNSSTGTKPQYGGTDGNSDWGQMNTQLSPSKSIVTRQVWGQAGNSSHQGKAEVSKK